MLLGWQGQGGPISRLLPCCGSAAGVTKCQACTAAGIDPDPPLVGIPAAAF